MDICVPGQSNPHAGGMRMKTVDEQVTSIMKTILERCEKEKSRNCLQVPLEDSYERVSFYTGLPKTFIYQSLHDGHYPNESFDDDDHILLMECINTFHKRHISPIIKDRLHDEFCRQKKNKSDLKYLMGSKSLDLKSFEWIINSLGYMYKRSLKGPPFVLLEEPKIKFQRFNYLHKLKDYRDNKNLKVYYVDERHILRPPFRNPFNQNDIMDRTFTNQDQFFFHLISNEGYEHGIFLSQDCGENLKESFKNWMLDIVLYSIKPGSVIVMANNPIHGSLVRKSITRYHSKKQMLQWLRENNIPCDPDMRKPRLYELIEKCTVNNEDYDIDRVFKMHGHHVLRLPDNFPSLNRTKYMWDFINENFKCNKNVEEMRNSLLNFIFQIEKSMWVKFFDQCRMRETRIFEIDEITEDLLENNCDLDEKYFYDSHSNSIDIDFLQK